MKSKSKKILSFLLLLTMLLGAFQPIVSMARGGSGGSEGSSGTAIPLQTNLTIHKLKYDTTLDKDKKIKNDGTVKEYDASILPYDATEYGEVGFTLYRLNNAKVVEMIKTAGNAQSVANNIAEDIAGNTTNGTIIKVEVPEVKQTSGTDPMSMIVTTITNGEYFLLVETTSPATVADKAQPMLLQFPMRSTDGKSLLNEVHLYPKNKVDETSRELEFTKVVEKIGSGEYPVFQGAEFEVYKGKPGEGTKLMKDGNPVKLTSYKDGKFKITGLAVGNYYLVEVPTTLVDSIDKEVEKSTSKPFIVSPFAKNDTKNKFAFRMDEDGKLYRITEWKEGNPVINKDTNLLEGGKFNNNIINLVKPSSSKKLNSKSGSIGYGDILEYEIKVNLPATLGRKSITDEKYEVIDTASEGFIIDESSIKIYDRDGKEVPRNIITKNYINIEKIKDNQFKFTFSKNSFTPDKKVHVYGPFTIKYNAKLSKDLVITEDTKLSNKIVGEYTIDGNTYPDPENPADPKDPVDPNNPDKPNPVPENEKEVVVDTFVKNLKKVDSGIFGTGAVKNPIAGAEFILGRKIGEKVEYRKLDNENKYAWTEIKADAQVVTSSDDGTFKFEGLASKTNDGVEITYFTEEVKAPEHYVLPVNEADRKHEFTFTDTNTNTELPIENNKSVDAPMTGYEKSTLVILGLGMILATAAVIERKKKTA